MKRTPMFLHLSHGRTDPSEDMYRWGEDGPVLKIAGFHATYNSVLHVGVPTDHPNLHRQAWIDFDTHKGLVWYGGMWYGDFAVFATGTDPHLEARAEDIVIEATAMPDMRATNWTIEGMNE